MIDYKHNIDELRVVIKKWIDKTSLEQISYESGLKYQTLKQFVYGGHISLKTLIKLEAWLHKNETQKEFKENNEQNRKV